MDRVKRLLRSFADAARGIAHCILHERNMRIHFIAVGLVTAVGSIYRLTRPEWIGVLLCFGLVLSLEAVNTAIEAAVDLASPGMHPLAKTAKDAAAGAVLLAAVISVIVAAVAFSDPIRWQAAFAWLAAHPLGIAGVAAFVPVGIWVVFFLPYPKKS